jgi:hypothetical protein
MGSGTTTGVRDNDGVTAGGVEAEGRDGVASREAAAQMAGNLGSLMAQTKISPPIPNTLLVSTDIVQPIPKM